MRPDAEPPARADAAGWLSEVPPAHLPQPSADDHPLPNVPLYNTVK